MSIEISRALSKVPLTRPKAQSVEPYSKPYKHAFAQLRAERMTTAAKPFLARGITVKRCEQCYLGKKYCICPWLKSLPEGCDIDFLLLMHRDEILKPTNTGRLLAEAFPQQCWAFEWSRLEPGEQLLKMLADPKRQCAIVYPANDERGELAADANTAATAAGKRLTLIILDGTWRQAARMMNHSKWLAALPVFPLAVSEQAGYAVRKASDASRLSTAEAAVLGLQQLGCRREAKHLHHIFTLFNDHYHATRACTKVQINASHDYLSAL